MPRVRKTIGRDERLCPVCEQVTWFHLYESWEQVSKRSRLRSDVRQSGQCERCGYKVIARSVTPD